MAAGWQQATMSEVKVGDRIRLANGRELVVSEIESPFFGVDEMLAFIEVTDSSWYKQPGQGANPVEIWREA
jgi:hypothetical protein